MEITIVKLKQLVDGLLGWVRSDLTENLATPQNSWLFKTFGDVVLDGTNFYQQLYELIYARNTDDSRRLLTRLMFDRDRANLPTMHINYPTEEGRSGDNTIGTSFKVELEVNAHVNYFSRSYVGQYELIVTGGTSVEVVILYEFMNALLIAGADTLAVNFDKFEFSGKQLMTNPEIIPYLIFYRSITISIQDRKTVKAIAQPKPVVGVDFIPTYKTE